MSWKVYRWVWRLEAPMYIGMPPAGSLNRCRLYVPARTLWGAFTAEIARSDNFQGFPDYNRTGERITSDCRFTYLYPAEKSRDDYKLYLPMYKKDRGLQWLYGDDKRLSNREVRLRLLSTRPGTAIDPENVAAVEGSLRETECVNPWWRRCGDKEEQKPVFMVGYIFTRNTEIKERMDSINTLFVGGDTRYGLGKLSRLDGLESKGTVFKKQVVLDGDDPGIQSKTAWGHVKDKRTEGIYGAKELWGGWNMGELQCGKTYWVPGSSVVDRIDCNWLIDEYGYWKLSERNRED